MSASLLDGAACAHCALPIGRLGQRRELNGEPRWFCCYGCCLAYQVHRGERDEPQAAAALIRLGVGGFLAMNVMLFSLLLYARAFAGDEAWLQAPVRWLLWLLATPLVLLLGAPFLAGAAQSLRRGRLSTDMLVSIGVLAAYGYSVIQLLRGSDLLYFDTAAMVLVLFTLGRYLEAQGRVQAARSLAPMLAAERTEVRIVDEGQGEAARESMLPAREVVPGMRIRILPGERIAVDGIVLDGCSECNEAILTGQPQPRAKTPGMAVHAGSVNGSGALLVLATVAGTRTRWVQISRLGREALARKSMTGALVERVVAAFIPGVLLLALATAGYWNGRADFDTALMAGLAVLVVACPCALGLAAPLGNALAIGAAAQRGILVRGGGVLENLARLKGIAFDKTGTLSDGELRPQSVTVEGTTTDELMRRAGALAAGSSHPVARAIVSMAAAGRAGAMSQTSAPSLRRGRRREAAVARRIHVRPGAGVRGEIDGAPCALGSAAFMTALGWSVPRCLLQSAGGGTHAYVGWAGRVRGCIAFADAAVTDATDSIAMLRARGYRILLLSGDAPGAVAHLAESVGIARWHAQLLPEDKVRLLNDWRQQLGAVAMVGDGLNDGPVLAAASVGIAVGGATDLAQESADVILPRAGLASLPWLLQQAARARRSLQINLIWAFAYNAVALSLAVAGWLQPVIAAALMAGSSLLVVLRSWRASRRDDAASEPRRCAVSAASAGRSFEGGPLWADR